MERVISSLLWNATTYAPGAPVRVSLKRNDDTVRLEVADQGPGIAPADVERIFRRFERAVNAREHASLGLGLYIVRTVAAAHGGSVTVDSELGKGARFIVELSLMTQRS